MIKRGLCVAYSCYLKELVLLFFLCRPLFSCSLLTIVPTLLEQTKDVEVQILGCYTLVDFITLQVHLINNFRHHGYILVMVTHLSIYTD